MAGLLAHNARALAMTTVDRLESATKPSKIFKKRAGVATRGAHRAHR
jgi:hypothetical protein